jgi:hypothetical protein
VFTLLLPFLPLLIYHKRDPIPRMLSDDDFMGQWLRNRPAAATRVEKRAAMLQALFRGGWISANATHPSSSSSNSRLELTAQAAAAVNATASKVAGAATEAALGLLPDVSGSGGGFGLSASSSEQRFAHVGTMHVIVPGSRRVRDRRPLCQITREQSQIQ